MAFDVVKTPALLLSAPRAPPVEEFRFCAGGGVGLRRMARQLHDSCPAIQSLVHKRQTQLYGPGISPLSKGLWCQAEIVLTRPSLTHTDSPDSREVLHHPSCVHVSARLSESSEFPCIFPGNAACGKCLRSLEYGCASCASCQYQNRSLWFEASLPVVVARHE